jgi:hypothetical protein
MTMYKTCHLPPEARLTRRNLFGTLFAGPGLMLLTGAAIVPMMAGTVIAVSGSCTARGRVLKSGAAVQVDDAVAVPADGRLKLRMVDGSMISIAPDSGMTVAGYNVGSVGRIAKLSLAQGLLRAMVAPVEGPSTFEIATAVGTASAHSADWFIEAQVGSVQVGVLAGTVDLMSAVSGRAVSIPARWGTRLEAKRDPVQPRVWAHVEFAAFIRRTE